MTGGWAAFLVLLLVLFATMAAMSFYIYYGRLIMRSRVAGVPVSVDRMVRITLSGLNANALVTAYLDAHKGGVQVTLDELESYARSQGDPRAAVKRLVDAKREGRSARIEDL